MRKFFAPLIFSILLAITVAAQNVNGRENVIVLQRSECLLRLPCPSYSILVFENGEFVFTGWDHVNKRGIFRGKFTNDEYKKAVDLITAYRIEDFGSEYLFHASEGCEEVLASSDTHIVTIQVQHQKIRKTVVHHLGCRGFDRQNSLIDLENGLDEIFNTQLWILGQ